MATAAIEAQGAASAGRWRGDDFAAGLPPMLVKELRQGVQSGVFFWTFLLFQAAMFLIFSLQVLMEEANPGPMQEFTASFWLAVVAGVAVLVPLRGLGAIGSERQGNALDLLQITRLSATRIVGGKWAALVAQSCLVAATLLPYLVIRYFFGGVDVLAELRWLGWILAAAAVVAAAAIALSTLPLWLRIGTTLTASGAAFVLLVAVVEGPLGRTLFGGFGWQAAAGLLATLAVYTLACLQLAASRIAPPAENHALRHRLLALVAAAAWPLAGWLGTREAAGMMFAATAPLLVATAVGTLVERPSRVRTLFAPFRRAGVAGRLAAAMCTPGWATGIVFLAAMAAMCGAGWLGFVQRFVAADARPVMLASATLLLAVVVAPLPFTALLTRVRYPLLLSVLVQIICLASFVVGNACKPWNVSWDDFGAGRLATLPFPLGALGALLAIESPELRQSVAPTFTIAGVAVIGFVLAVLARPWLRELAACGRLVRGEWSAARPSARADTVAVRRSPAAAVRPWVWRGNDFPGWLSPMLVRELRQGVQSGVFAWTFIGIQGAMFALMFWAVGTFGGSLPGGHARDFAGMFWGAIAAAIVVIVPLRGLTAVSGERAASNLDLVRLTRLSATRIILGKWLAIVGQGLLVATALLPYLVLRYFFGGQDVVVDLELFGWMVASSMVVAAAALALSTLPLWARIGIVVVVAVVGFVPTVYLLQEAFRGRLTFASLGTGGRLGILAGLVVATVALLEYAAARIAPPAENHAGRMRLVAVGLAAAWAAVGVVGSEEAFLVTLFTAGPLLLCYAIGALLEQSVPIAALYRPFGRWGAAGRLAAAVFTPGWATAVPFVALVAGLCLTGWMAFFARRQPNHFLAGLTLGCLWAAAVIFPLPVLVRWPRARPRLLLYGLVQLACFMLFVYLQAVAPRSRSWADAGYWMFTLPFPLAALPAFVVLSDGNPTMRSSFPPVFLTAAALTTLVVLGLVARPWLAEIRRTLRLTRDARTHAGPQPPPPAGS